MKYVLLCLTVAALLSGCCIEDHCNDPGGGGGTSPHSFAISFDGSTTSLLRNSVFDYTAPVPEGARFDSISNTFTIELWANPTAIITSDVERTSGESGISGQRYAVWPTHIVAGTLPFDWGVGAGISIGTNGVGVYEHGDDYLPALLFWSGSLVGWHHIAVVYQNKQPSLYIDGELVRTGLTSTASIIHPGIDMIGGNPVGYGNFAGKLDELRVWNAARTPDQIRTNMHTTLQATEPGLDLYLRMNEGTGLTTADSSRSQKHYDLIGSPTWVSPGAP